MPKLGQMDEEKIGGTNYGYSAVRVDDLGASEYTLATLVVDRSGSTDGYSADQEKCIKAIVTTLRKHPRADNLLLRLVVFDDRMDEIHGFKQLADCNPSDYDGVVNARGMTALYDTVYNAVEASNQYGRKLLENEYEVNGIVFVITDGLDNRSRMTPGKVNEAIKAAVSGENMESMLTILVGITHNNPDVERGLRDFTADGGFDQYEVLENADERGIAKVANLASQSISSQSQSLGSGGKSQTLTF